MRWEIGRHSSSCFGSAWLSRSAWQASFFFRNFAQLPRQIQMTSLRLHVKNLALYTASSKLFVVVRMMLLYSFSYRLLQKDTRTIAREFGFLFLAELRAPCETTNLCTKYSTEDSELYRCSRGSVA